MPKVVIPDYPEREIQERKRKGLDLRDEVWDGVYHLSSSPTWEQQRIVGKLIAILIPYCEKHDIGRVNASVNVRVTSAAEENYRVPDAVFIAKGREKIITDGLWIDSGPDLVVEVRSKDDETNVKIPFYEKIGTKEHLIIDSQTKEAELYRNKGGRFFAVSPDTDGWLYCESVRAFFKSVGEKIVVRLELDKTEHEI